MTRRLIKIAASMLVTEVKARYQPATSGTLSTDEVASASASAAELFDDLPTDTRNSVETLACIELEAAEGEEVRWEVRH